MTPTQDDMFAGLAIFNPVVTGTGTINGKQIFNSLDSMGDDGLLITNQYVEELEVHYKSNNTEEVDDIPLVLEKKSYFSKSVSSSTKEKLVSKNTLKDNYVDEGLDVVHKNKPLHIEVKRDDMSYVEHKADHDEVIDYDTKDDENEPSEAAVDYLELFIHLDRKWYVYVTEEGDVYYYDESTATSQWEDPREHGIIVYEEANEVDGGSDHSSPQKSIGKSGSTSPCPPKSPSPKSLLKFKDFPIDGEVPRSDIKPIPINWASASSSKDGIASGVRLSIDTDNTEDFDCESSPRSFQEEDDGSRNSLHGIATGEKYATKYLFVNTLFYNFTHLYSILFSEKSSGMRLYKKYSNHSISDGDDDDDFDEILVRDLTSTRRIVNQTTEATTANISEEKDIPISDSKEERLDDFAVKSSGLSSLVAKEKMTNEFEKITLRNDRQQSDANFSSNEYGVDYESKGNLKLSQEVKIITPQSDSTLAHLQLCSPEKFPDNNIYSLLSPSVVSPLPTTASTTPPSRLGMYEELINSGASLVELGNIFEARGDSLEFSSKVLSLADEKLYNNVINSRQRQETGLEIISYEYLNLSNDRIGYVTTDIDNEKLQNLQNHPILCRYINMAALGLPFQSVVVQMEVDGIARPLIAEIEQLFAINNYDDVDVDTYETDKTMGTPDKGKSTGSNLLLSPISLKQVTRTWAYKSAVVQNDEVDIITDADLEEFDKLVKENVDNKLIDSSNTQPLLVITKELSDKIAHLVSQIDLPTYSVVPKAITSLDTLDDSIDLDFLEELQELLKLYMESNITNEQMKLLSSSKNHSEIFLSGLLLFQPDLSRRLGCFISCLSFDDICISVLYKSKKVIKCCNQVRGEKVFCANLLIRRLTNYYCNDMFIRIISD